MPSAGPAVFVSRVSNHHGAASTGPMAASVTIAGARREAL